MELKGAEICFLAVFFLLLRISAAEKGEVEILLSFKASIADHLRFLSSWNSSSDCCNWNGISCNDASHVVGIDFSGKNLSGIKALGEVQDYGPSSGTYFVVVDHTLFGFENDIAFCEYLIREVGVVAIPTSVLYLNPEDGKNLVRFTFYKDEGTLRAAVERMKERLKGI